MEVMIGVDPHKGSHTATMLDRTEHELRRITLRAGHRQLEQLLEWADGVTPRTWAVEAAGGMGDLLSQQLVAAGEAVLNVPATLASRVRVLSTGQSTKSDTNDAHSVAVAALRAPILASSTRGGRCHGVSAAGQASQRSGSLAQQVVLPSARPRRRVGARRDHQRSGRQPGTQHAFQHRA